MKKITLLFLALTGMFNVANAQITIFDFDGTVRATENWNGDTFASIANPLPDAVNSSANVGKFTHLSDGGSIGITNNISVDATVYKSVEMMVYLPEGGYVEIQTLDSSWNSIEYLKTTPAQSPVTTGWVKLTFNLTKTTTIGIIQLMFNYYKGGTYPAIAYYDNLVFKSGTLGVDDLKIENNTMAFYPNPAADYINVNKADKVVITDLNGRVVKEAANVEQVNISSLAKGVYIVKIGTGNTAKSSKLIKE